MASGVTTGGGLCAYNKPSCLGFWTGRLVIDFPMTVFFFTDHVSMVMNFVALALGPTGRVKMLILKTTKPTWRAGQVTNKINMSLGYVWGVPTRRSSLAGE